MTGDKVQADFNLTPVGFPAESIEIAVGPVTRGDPVIIRYIITGILERRDKTRINPDGVDAQPLEIVQFLYNPRDVTDTVSVGIVIALGINLVKNGLIEPGGII
jgi:hypothetical protein